jgi:hypothetical protein
MDFFLRAREHGPWLIKIVTIRFANTHGESEAYAHIDQYLKDNPQFTEIKRYSALWKDTNQSQD